MTNNPLVYSTDFGRIKESAQTPEKPTGDGIVRIRRETKGRKGKGVTTISGLIMDNNELKGLAKELKKICGTGGAVKQQTIEIQGDNRDKIKAYLEQKNFTVKLAGG
ncbi:MAG: stress response translation initiation inhibitor YciH [Alteromonadaceae bacterium]|nr:stress response translation initiation inhibitor YciH [Alteromonadaceae bacterium]